MIAACPSLAANKQVGCETYKMEISKQLQEQQEKAEELFTEAEAASRVFIKMAEDEGLSRREIQDRWMVIVDWGMKERSAEMWKRQLDHDLGDTTEEIIEDMDRREEDLMTYVQPEDELEYIEGQLAKMLEYMQQLMGLYVQRGTELGIPRDELQRRYSKIIGNDAELPETTDIFDEDIDE